MPGRPPADLDSTLRRLPAALTREQALGYGLTRAGLNRLLKEDRLERFGHGLLMRPDLTETADLDLIEARLRAPAATLCLSSALARHQLTDNIPASTHLAIPRGTHCPASPSSVTWHSYDPTSFEIGRGKIELAKDLTLGLYSPERSIIDAFNPRLGDGHDLAIEALKQWLIRPGSQPAGLLRMAQAWPAARAGLTRTLQVLL